MVVLSLAGLMGWWALLRGMEPWRAPEEPGLRFLRGDILMAGLLALFFLSSILEPSSAERIQITTDIIVKSAAFLLGVAAFLLAFLFARRLKPIAMFGFTPEHPGRVLLIGLACLLATYPLVGLLSALVTHAGTTPSDGDGMVQFLKTSDSWEGRMAGIVLAVCVAPFVEEVIFRGYLLGVVRQHFGRVTAAIATSILFAAVHQNIPGIPALFVLGLGFAFAYERTGSILAPMFMHVLFNAANVVVLFHFPELAR